MTGVSTSQIDNCLRTQRRYNKRGSYAFTRKWLEESCECYAHQFSRIWFEETKDSFVFDVEKVRSVGGAVGYVSKYIAKSFDEWERLNEMGFTRRMVASRNWPREKPLHLRGTVENGGWFRVETVKRTKVDNGIYDAMVRDDDGVDQCELVNGSELGNEIRAKAKKKRELERIRRLLK